MEPEPAAVVKRILHFGRRPGAPGRRTRFFVFFVSLVYTIRMHPLFKEADELSHLAIGAAVEVQVDYQLSRNEAGGRRRADDSARSKPGRVKGLNIRKRGQRRRFPSIYVAI